MQTKLWTDHDDRAARVVHPLTEQVLTEATVLALEHVGERAERTLVGTGEDLAAATVVEEGVDGLLQHPLLVADDDLRSVEVLQTLEPVVPVDDATVQIVEVRGREATTVQRDQWAKIGRNDRTTAPASSTRAVAAVVEGLDDLETLGNLAALGPLRCVTHLVRSSSASALMSIWARTSRIDFAAHADLEGTVAVTLDGLVVVVLGEDLTFLERGLTSGRSPRRPRSRARARGSFSEMSSRLPIRLGRLLRNQM